jgi:hypothetical protein
MRNGIPIHLKMREKKVMNEYSLVVLARSSAAPVSFPFITMKFTGFVFFNPCEQIFTSAFRKDRDVRRKKKSRTMKSPSTRISP